MSTVTGEQVTFIAHDIINDDPITMAEIVIENSNSKMNKVDDAKEGIEEDLNVFN